jgi:signal transduction histidine kinase
MPRSGIAWTAGVAVAYFLAAKLGLTLATVGVTVTLVWPPSGVAVAAMLLGGRRVWPGVALGAFAANATSGAPLSIAFFTAVGNPLEAIIAATLLGRARNFDRSLERVRDVIALAVFGTMVAPIAGASIGVAGLLFAGVVQPDGALAAWFTWWGGDAMGILIVAPLILAWFNRPPRRASIERAVEATALVAVTGVAVFLVFGGLLPARVAAPLVYAAFPLLIWAALSFELRGAATGAAVMSALAVWWTSRGAGPFAQETLGLSLAHLNAFICVATLTSLVLAAIVRERRRADAARSESLVRERMARRDAESASHAKSDFLAVMSHELRTPLNAIIGYASLLADGVTGPLSDAQAVQLGRVRASATHLLALIEQILSLSRIEARQEDVRLERVDARTLVAEAAGLVEPLIASKGLALDVDVPADACRLDTDVTKVRQILLNLLTNAAKFTDHGTIRCRVSAESASVMFDVSDTGRGIAPDDLARVFEPFWQGDAGRTRPEGAGLGLSVSRRLAQLLGGDITVRSTAGRGSTFALSLPRAAPNDDILVPAVVAGLPGRTVPVAPLARR